MAANGRRCADFSVKDAGCKLTLINAQRSITYSHCGVFEIRLMHPSLKAIVAGIVGGFCAVAAYTLIVIGDLIGLPKFAAIMLAACFGPLLLVASYGLRDCIRLNGPSVSAELGFVFNSAAAALVTAMFLVQIGVGDAFPPLQDRDAAAVVTVHMVDRVQLSLDMAWDVFATMGAVLFGLSMLSHPRLGRLLGALGITVGSALFALNLCAFPRQPTEIGWPDLGPALGAWYLLVSLALCLGLGWIRQRTSVNAEEVVHSLP
jgi:hypothetical protein